MTKRYQQGSIESIKTAAGLPGLVVFSLVPAGVLLFVTVAFALPARAQGTIESFIGLLAGKSNKLATLDELTEAAAQGWAGEA